MTVGVMVLILHNTSIWWIVHVVMFGRLFKPWRTPIWATPDYWSRSLIWHSYPPGPLFSNHVWGFLVYPILSASANSCHCLCTGCSIWGTTTGFAEVRFKQIRSTLGVVTIQRDYMNHAICAAFLCIYHCPFLHICGIYWHDPQNIWLATASNYEVRQNEEKLAPPFVVEVHSRLRFQLPPVQVRAPLLICRLGQVLDTLQVN